MDFHDHAGQLLGRFFFNARLKKINVHCLQDSHICRGVRCKTDRDGGEDGAGTGRPVGLLTAWLLLGPDHDTKGSHQNVKRWLRSPRAYALRRRARNILKARPEFAPVFRLERRVEDGADSEPERV